MRLLSLAILSLACLAACGEKPQTLPQSERRAESRDQTPRIDGQRERTLSQDESRRTDGDNVIR